MGSGLQLLACVSAFQVALFGYGRDQRGGRLRMALGLALGACAAHAGGLLLAPESGSASVLFVPLGVLLVAPSGRARRRAFLGPALAALPLAFAVARLGCLAAGCCPPVPWAEAMGLVALAAGLRRLPRSRRGAVALAGLGAVRLATEPLRGSPPEALALALVWILAGVPQPGTARRIRAGAGAGPRRVRGNSLSGE